MSPRRGVRANTSGPLVLHRLSGIYPTNGDGTIAPVDALLVINHLNDPSNQAEGEGAVFVTESLVASSNQQDNSYAAALASYVLQNEESAPSQRLRTALSSLVDTSRDNVDAYRVAYDTALAVAEEEGFDFAELDLDDVLDVDSLHDNADLNDSIFGANEDWV